MEMSADDPRIQIPTQAWLTSNIFVDIDLTLKSNPSMSLQEYVSGQKTKTNIFKENPEFPIYNLGSLLMMAYAFLVIPKESIEKYKLNVSSPEIDGYLSKIKIEINENKNCLGRSENIIRHIRNSVAHARFDMFPNDKLLFIDELNGTFTFKGEMEINDFKALISAYFGTYYGNYHQRFIANTNGP